ncbi:MAG: Lrp/AsnC family transcriptional regulator [SAR202 cluster bacterium]|jgi:Lrp/AsnC family transcriptional regulator for asnA, asnC and gidA|nr:Lrp/AsnC family transcriptional regulator [SAR202 cluster bacterium]
MDELDTKITAMLQEDGRASNAGIARKVGVSEGTVRRRLKRLIQDEYISVVAMLDPGRMGYASEALIGVQVDPDKIDQVSVDLAHLDETNFVAVTTGSFDIFCWATLTSSEALGIFLRTKVGTIPGVRRSETFVNLAVKKRGYGANL